MHSQGFGGITFQRMQIFEENTRRVGGLDLFEKIIPIGLRGLGGIPIRSMHSQGFGGIKFQRMQLFEDNTRRVGGLDLFEEIIHVGLRGPGGVPIWSMHSQGFGGITLLWMQLFEENTRRVGGLTSSKKSCLWDCEALEEFPSRVCTLKVSEELHFYGCKSLQQNTFFMPTPTSLHVFYYFQQ
jgi:hypothetical protein